MNANSKFWKPQYAARKANATARMDEVACEAGLSVEILYWYFKGKVEKPLALMDLFLAPDAEALTHNAKRKLKPAAKKSGTYFTKVRLRMGCFWRCGGNSITRQRANRCCVAKISGGIP